MDIAQQGKLLIVDDEQVNRDIYNKLFTKAGYSVSLASNSAEAYQNISTNPPDIILLDVMLGNESGFDVLKMIKADEKNNYMYVVMISSQLKSSDDKVEGLTLGADGYVTRPVESRELIARIDAFMRHKLTIESLRKSEARFKKIIEKNPDAMLVINDQGVIEFANPAAQDLFQLTIDKLLSRVFGYPVIKGEHTEINIIRQDQDTAVAEMRSIDIDWESRDSHLTSIRDITERRRIEQHLQQTQKMESIGKLTGGIAHDFNNLLGIINGYAELLLTDMEAGEDKQEEIAEILNAGKKAAMLTNRLLSFSRKQIMHPVVINLNETIKETRNMLLRVLGEDITLSLNLQDDLYDVLFDPGQVEQIVVNLATNAREAMPAGGTLLIETSNVEIDDKSARKHFNVTPGPHVMLAVSDTGTGMEPETVNKIFEPFFTTRELGTGLGLATVYGIIRQSGGDIWVYSEKDKGTTFKIYLPKTIESRQFDKATKHENLEGSGVIMVVEDVDELRHLTARLLKNAGYKVLEAASGDIALDMSKRNGINYDLLLTDIVMPGISGKELSENLLGMEQDLKVLYMSGYTDNIIAEHGILEPGINLISKPFSAEDLLFAVKKKMEE
jgi:signal transduction histidine kinase